MNTVNSVKEIKAWPKNSAGWHVAPNGDRVTLGDEVMLGNDVTLGDQVTLGDWVRLGDRVRLGRGVTSMQIIQQRIDALIHAGQPLRAWKWVTQERQSPNFDGGTAIEYPKDAVIEAEGEVSDQQCAPGLHILPVGVRPEHAGLCSADHGLIPLLVEYQPEDILFPGLPGNSDKIRVRKLRVLE